MTSFKEDPKSSYLKRPSFGVRVQFFQKIMTVEVLPLFDRFRVKLNIVQLAVVLQHGRLAGPDVPFHGDDKWLPLDLHLDFPFDLDFSICTLKNNLQIHIFIIGYIIFKVTTSIRLLFYIKIGKLICKF